jgi:heterodisulfide reductase subunit A
MCSARVDEDFIWRAFRKGAAMVLVSGCHYADCHYIDANRQMVVRVNRVWDKMEKLGIRPERLQLEWISAAEGQKFAKVMRDVEEMRRKVTKAEVEETVRILTEEEEKARKRAAAKEARKTKEAQPAEMAV